MIRDPNTLVVEGARWNLAGLGGRLSASLLPVSGRPTEPSPCPLLTPDRTFPQCTVPGQDGRLCLWDLTQGECLLDRPGTTRGFHPVTLTPDGMMLIQGRADGGIVLWSLELAFLARLPLEVFFGWSHLHPGVPASPGIGKRAGHPGVVALCPCPTVVASSRGRYAGRRMPHDFSARGRVRKTLRSVIGEQLAILKSVGVIPSAARSRPPGDGNNHDVRAATGHLPSGLLHAPGAGNSGKKEPSSSDHQVRLRTVPACLPLWDVADGFVALTRVRSHPPS